MSDSDHIAWPDEHVGLAKGDAAIDELRCAGDNEEGLAILLELRSLMRLLCIFDGEMVQVELLLDFVEQLVAGLEQSDPHDMSRLGSPLLGIRDRVEVLDLASLCVDGSADNARRGVRQFWMCRNGGNL